MGICFIPRENDVQYRQTKRRGRLDEGEGLSLGVAVSVKHQPNSI